MFHNENEFEKMVRNLNWDDRPDPDHRDRLEMQLRKALIRPEGRPFRPDLGRFIMQRVISKYAAVAAVLIVILGFGWFAIDHNGPESTITLMSFLNKAIASEQALFSGDKIIHLINEIIVYPAPPGRNPELDIENIGPDSEWDEHVSTVNKWLDHTWIPVCTLQANGRFRFHQLTLPTDQMEAYTIVDQAWYDPVRGCFARLVKNGERIVFANSFDGESVYFTEADDTGVLQVSGEAIGIEFQRPTNPAEFLGLSAGLRSSIEENEHQPLQEVTGGALADGTPVKIYKMGFADLEGKVNTYYLFRVREDNQTIVEIESVVAGATQMVIRRTLTETVETTAISWNLAEVKPQAASGDDQQIALRPDAVIPNVTVAHMVERSTYVTYLFSKDPAWTSERRIMDCLDLTDSSHRMFFIIYTADSGRDVLLVNSRTYNLYFGRFLGEAPALYTSPSGVKAWSGGPEKWWTNIVIKSAQLTPAQDRRGFVLGTPAGSYVALAINGPVSDEELHQLVDSLIPAKDHPAQ